MTDTDGGAAGAPFPVTVAGLTVTMRPCGWIDYVGIPREFSRILDMPLSTAAEEEAFAEAVSAFGARLDAYAVGAIRPSMVPPAQLGEFLGRWRTGVRDAVVDPPSSADSPRRTSTSRRRGGA